MTRLRQAASRIRILSGAVFCLSVLPLSGAAINVFGTGLDNSGNFLLPGGADTHWTLTSGGSTTYVAQGATLAEHNSTGVPVGWPLLPGLWATSSLSQWLAPTADVTSIIGSGEYDFQTTFDLSGFLPNTAEIKGNWTADNLTLGIYLNGVLIPNTTTTDVNGFLHLLSFDITSGFVPGVNTLSFHVLNSPLRNNFPDPNPTGLLVELSGTANTAPVTTGVPEPGTLIVVGFGLVFVGLVHRRRKLR